MGRYDANDKRQRSPIDGNPKAKSPRNAASVRASGSNGRNGSNSTADVTSGTHGNTSKVRRPKRNTMRNAAHGGESTFAVRTYDVHGERIPAEFAAERLTYGDWDARVSVPLRRKIDRPDTAIVGHDAATLRRVAEESAESAREASRAEGLRRQAMARHSLMTRNGAVGVRTEMMKLRDGTWPNGEPKYRLVPIDAPVFADDPTEDESGDEE